MGATKKAIAIVEEVQAEQVAIHLLWPPNNDRSN